MVSLGSLPLFRGGRSTSEDVDTEGETRGGELETAIEGGAEFIFGEYCWLFAGGKGKSGELLEKAHSFFIPGTDLRSCCPEIRPEPANICCGCDNGPNDG